MSAPETLEGWFALHDLRRLDRAAWRALPSNERSKAVAEAVDLLSAFEKVDDSPTGRSVTYSMIGHKADLLLFHLRPEAHQLHGLERIFDETVLAGYMSRSFSYLSVTEISRHGAPEGAAANIEDSPYVQARLYPDLPPHDQYVCFYPMSKKREGADNWYSLADAERADLMRVHGRTGRRYAGRVTQIVTGSTGLDDWEWGVTLFSDDPLQFKRLVFEMRFDEVSARFAEFGPFYVGRRLHPADLGRFLGE
ncbi:MAG TPA: hydrogen peroxide-dependent heme synthase [Acidimicrobiia bacterium]|nr:hydrogen peroxide-dependent heme synthase [Acidimicrobiia bacterium]